MNVGDLCEQLQLEIRAGRRNLHREVRHGYAADLLSYAMVRARPGCVWVTLQGHINVVGVASLTEAAAVVITEGLEPDAAAVEKAEQEGIPIFTTELTTYSVVARMVELGIPGVDEVDG